MYLNKVSAEAYQISEHYGEFTFTSLSCATSMYIYVIYVGVTILLLEKLTNMGLLCVTMVYTLLTFTICKHLPNYLLICKNRLFMNINGVSSTESKGQTPIVLMPISFSS